MKRRDFFKALCEIFGASVWTSASATHSHAHLPDGRSIVVEGSADHEAILGRIRVEMAAANQEMMRQLERNIGAASNKWDQRYGE